jgi:ABC-type antimicrobial peptide transport system permease subunit
MMATVKEIGPLTWAVRTHVPPFSVAAAVQHAIESAADLSADRIRSMDQVLDASTTRNRFQTTLLGIFALIAIVLASIGIFGVIACSIAERTQEFAIRMALGADASNLRNRIVGEAMALAAAGIAIGVASALALTRLMTAVLYRVDARDPLVLVVAAMSLLFVSLLAGLVAAGRARRIDLLAGIRSAPNG